MWFQFLKRYGDFQLLENKDNTTISHAGLKFGCQMYSDLAVVWKVFKENSSLIEHLDLIEDRFFVFVFLKLLLHFPAGLVVAQRGQDIAQSHKAYLYLGLNLKVFFCLLL